MIEINLIPDVKQTLLKAQRMRAAVISGSIAGSIIAASVVVLLLLYVFGFQLVRSNLLDGQIDKGAQDLAKVQELSKILTIQNQLGKIQQLSGERTINSRIFDMLSAVTPAGENAVQFSDLTLTNEDKTIRLEGQTRAYDSMEVFKKTLDGAIIEYTKKAEPNADGTASTPEVQKVKLATEISINDISYGEDTGGKKVVRFAISFKYAEELFSPATVAPAFKLSVNGNVTDSYLGIPRTLFTERAKDL